MTITAITVRLLQSHAKLLIGRLQTQQSSIANLRKHEYVLIENLNNDINTRTLTVNHN